MYHKAWGAFLRSLLVGALIVIGTSGVFTAAAQDTGQALLFVAREDTNGDGLLNVDDLYRLYYSAPGIGTTAISAPNANVVRYDVALDGQQVAYLAQENGNSVVSIVDLVDRTTITSDAFADLSRTAIYFNESGLWGIGANADGIPVIRGITAGTGEIFAEKVTQYPPQAFLTMDSTKSWFMAFSPNNGALSVYESPSLESVPFEIWGYSANTTPSFSPVAANLLVGMRSEDDPNDLGTFVIDVSVPETQRIDLPDNAPGTQMVMLWSGHGRWIALIVPSEEFITLTGLDGQSIQMPLVERSELVTGWSATDMYFSGRYEDENSDSRQIIHNTATGEIVELDALNDHLIYNVAWHPSEDTTLAFVGQSLLDGQYGVFLLDVTTGEVTEQAASADENMVEGKVRWAGDGAELIALMPSGDPVLLASVSAPKGLFRINLADATTERLSPESTDVLRDSVTLLP